MKSLYYVKLLKINNIGKKIAKWLISLEQFILDFFIDTGEQN